MSSKLKRAILSLILGLISFNFCYADDIGELSTNNISDIESWSESSHSGSPSFQHGLTKNSPFFALLGEEVFEKIKKAPTIKLERIDHKELLNKFKEQKEYYAFFEYDSNKARNNNEQPFTGLIFTWKEVTSGKMGFEVAIPVYVGSVVGTGFVGWKEILQSGENKALQNTGFTGFISHDTYRYPMEYAATSSNEAKLLLVGGPDDDLIKLRSFFLEGGIKNINGKEIISGRIPKNKILTKKVETLKNELKNMGRNEVEDKYINLFKNSRVLETELVELKRELASLQIKWAKRKKSLKKKRKNRRFIKAKKRNKNLLVKTRKVVTEFLAKADE